MFGRKGRGDAHGGRRDRKRKVTLDSNVIISGVAHKSKSATEVIVKSTTDDQMMMSNVIYIECVRYAEKKDSTISKEDMEKELKELFPEPILIELPPDTELKRMYVIRDEKDLKILYSAEMTDSDIIVTGDNDFFDPNVRGPEGIRIIRPAEYLDEPKKRRFFRR